MNPKTLVSTALLTAALAATAAGQTTQELADMAREREFAEARAAALRSAAMASASANPAAAPASMPGPLPPEVQKAIADRQAALTRQPAGLPTPASTQGRGGPPSLAVSQAGNLALSVQAVSENRSNPGTGVVSLQVLLTGPDLSPLAVVRDVNVTNAVDNAGRSLLPLARGGPAISPMSLTNRLSAMLRTAARGGTGNLAATIALGSSARDAKSVALVEGTLEIYSPSEADGSIVTVENPMGYVGKPLADDPLTKNGIEFVILNEATFAEYAAKAGGGTMRQGNSIAVYIKDPRQKLAGWTFTDLTTAGPGPGGGGGGGTSMSGRTAEGTISQQIFSGGVPARLQLMLFIATDTSIKTVPFRLENLTLP